MNELQLEWMRKHSEGTISADEMAQLGAALREDAGFRSAFVEYTHIESALRDFVSANAPLEEMAGADATGLELSATGAARSHAESNVVHVPADTFRRWLRPAMAAAAVLLAAFLVWPLVARRGVSAEVLEARDAGPGWTVGTRFTGSEISLPAGSVKLRLASGVVLDLDGPLSAKFESPMRLRLNRGELNADVGENGKGFTVVTDAGEVVDLGTQFGLSTDGDGKTQVAVFSGEVQVFERPQAGGTVLPVTLLEGDAVVMERARKMQRVQSVVMDGERMRLASRRPKGAIVQVSDNLVTPDFNLFYGIVPAGMGSGAAAYTDNNRLRWHTEKGAAFPEELEGADVLRTFMSARHEEDFKLRCQVARRATVYVLFDERSPAPEWLKASFRPTDMKLRCGPQKQGKAQKPVKRAMKRLGLAKKMDTLFNYRVWKREAAPGEVVEFGPVLREDSAMYGVAVKALPEIL